MCKSQTIKVTNMTSSEAILNLVNFRSITHSNSDKPVVEPMYEYEWTEEEKHVVMNAVSLIKEKRCVKLKARICADSS